MYYLTEPTMHIWNYNCLAVSHLGKFLSIPVVKAQQCVKSTGVMIMSKHTAERAFCWWEMACLRCCLWQEILTSGSGREANQRSLLQCRVCMLWMNSDGIFVARFHNERMVCCNCEMQTMNTNHRTHRNYPDKQGLVLMKFMNQQFFL